MAKTMVVVNALGHPLAGDNTISLIAPDTTTTVVLTSNGSSGDAFPPTVFDDGAATAVTSGSAPFRGRFRPEQPLTGVNGQTAGGTWRMRLVGTVNGGTFRSWYIGLCVAP